MHASLIIPRFLKEKCPWMHAKRRDSLANMVESAQAGGLGVTKMAKCSRANTEFRYRLKCIDRSLSNPHLYHERIGLYRALSHRLLETHRRVGIIVDWSSLREDNSMQLLRAAAIAEGRAVTIYEEVHPQQKLGAPEVHEAFLANLKSVLPEHCHPIVITDAGFRSTWFKMVNAQGWSWIGRIRNNDTVRQRCDETWTACKALYDEARTRARDLGSFFYTQRNSTPCRLVIFKGRTKGRHAKTKLGTSQRSKRSEKARAAQREPWLLAVSPDLRMLSATKVIQLYAGRMQIEQTFRDLKNEHWGMGLRTCQTRAAHRLTILLLIAALLTFALWLLGLAAKRAGHTISYGSKKKATSAMSTISLAKYWFTRSEYPRITWHQLSEALTELISMIKDYEK